jgi:hypothetical protein
VSICTRRFAAVSRGLRELQQLELEIMASALLRRERHALRVVALLRIVQSRIRWRTAPCALTARLPSRRRSCPSSSPELPLARKHAVQIAVRREKTDRLRGDEVTMRRHEGFTDGERTPVAKRCADIVTAAHAAQPVGEEARNVRVTRCTRARSASEESAATRSVSAARS